MGSVESKMTNQRRDGGESLWEMAEEEVRGVSKCLGPRGRRRNRGTLVTTASAYAGGNNER